MIRAIAKPALASSHTTALPKLRSMTNSSTLQEDMRNSRQQLTALKLPSLLLFLALFRVADKDYSAQIHQVYIDHV